MVHFPHPDIGSQRVLNRVFYREKRSIAGEKSHKLLNALILRDPSDRVGCWGVSSPSGRIIAFRKHYRPAGSIVASWGLDVRRKLLLFYRNFGFMSPPPGEMLQIYIILGLFASSRCETGEIPVILQDSLSGKVVPIELLYLCRIRLPNRRVSGNGAVFRPVELSISLLITSFSTA